MAFLKEIAACLPGRGILFEPTYDAEVWAEFTLEDSADTFHVMDMWNFGSVPIDSDSRYTLDRNVDHDNPPELPERAAQTLEELLKDL